MFAMFRHKQEVATLKQALATTEQLLNVKAQQCKELETNLQLTQTKNQLLVVQQQHMEGTIHYLQNFGVSLLNTQTSLQSLASRLGNEKDNAVAAQNVSITSSNAIVRISDNLANLATSSNSAAHQAETLDQS